MDESSENSDAKNAQNAIPLLERRLARSEAARQEAEHLLETKSRSLTAAEEILRQKEAELLEHVNRQTLSLVSAQKLANVATFHGDEDKRFVGSNNFADVVGSKTPVTSFEQFAKMVHPQDREEAIGILLAADRGDLVDKNIERDFRFCDDFGNVRWLRWSVTQSRSPDGERFFGYGAVRDITKEHQAERQEQVLLKLSERRAKQLENISEDLKKARTEEERKSEQLAERLSEMEIMGAALEDARAEAVAADKSKSRFLAMMSHDIRTPMNAVMATLELLSISELNAEQQEQLDLARQSSDQMLFLLADIIEYARTDGWKLDIKMRDMNLHDLLNKAVSTWRPLAAKKKLNVALEISQNCPEFIISDPTRVRQIIDNFISNAIKYTSAGDICVSASFLEDGNEKSLKLAVSDTGDGIPINVQKRLFDDFDRGEASNSDIEGTGLGLSICKRIVKAMDGQIGVESNPGKGSNFWFEILVNIGDENRITPQISSAQNIKKLTINGRPPKILVAEDVEANQIVISAMLETMGCDAQVVDDGSKVLDALDKDRFDGILMDVWMPMNGMDTTRQIRSHKKHGKIPIYGVTAFAAEDERSAILASGMDGVIAKPINLAGLNYAIGQICGLGEVIDNAASEKDDTVPVFGRADVIDLNKFREQVFSVPEGRRTALINAVCEDIQSWHDKFHAAWMAGDQDGVRSAHHALRGICNGFGAFSLLEKIDAVHQSGQIQDADLLRPIAEILDFTLNAIRQSEKISDRRTE
ncbi:MAG: ATP-binding protein [Parasphingorhabdus sp.]|uniref:ATP-binding protein n=1 Tax=Parasphingorhabdus sp. TaxID=2709688 RepID=UPI0032991B3C